MTLVTPTFYYGSENSPTVAVGSVSRGYRANYAPEISNVATIHVLVQDPNARVYFDDTQTAQTGAERMFTSPELDPAKTFTYAVKATWMENGKEMTRTQEVRVKGGHMTTIDFRGNGDIQERSLLQKPREEKRDDKSEEKRDDKGNLKLDDKRIDKQ